MGVKPPWFPALLRGCAVLCLLTALTLSAWSVVFALAWHLRR